ANVSLQIARTAPRHPRLGAFLRAFLRVLCVEIFAPTQSPRAAFTSCASLGGSGAVAFAPGAGVPGATREGLMSQRHIAVEKKGRVAVIRMNRPRYRNAQSRIMLEEMTEAFAALDLDNSVHVIILAGAGDHFSAGHDIGTPEENADRDTL